MPETRGNCKPGLTVKTSHGEVGVLFDKRVVANLGEKAKHANLHRGDNGANQNPNAPPTVRKPTA